VISTSKKLAGLKTDGARLLYTWLIPHTDIEGRMEGDADVVKGTVVPRLKHHTTEKVQQYLEDMHDKNLIILYQNNGDQFIELVDFGKHQRLRADKEALSKIPAPPAIPETPGVGRELDGSPPTKDKISTEEDKLREDKLNTCPPQKVFELYKSICTAPKLYKPKLLSESRRAKIRTRNVEIARIIKEGGGNETIEQIWTQIFTTVNKNGFLNGNTPSTNPKYANFRADLDWLLENDKGYLKVLEGKYKDSVKRNLREPSPRSEFSGGKVDMRKVMKKQFGR
jgi:hypothetical protein